MPTFYVNSSGNDSNTGADENNAFATYGKAFLDSSVGDTIIIQTMVLHETMPCYGNRIVKIDGYVINDGGGVLANGMQTHTGTFELSPLGKSTQDAGGIICFEIRNFTGTAIGTISTTFYYHMSGVWAHDCPILIGFRSTAYSNHIEIYDSIFSHSPIAIGYAGNPSYIGDHVRLARNLFYECNNNILFTTGQSAREIHSNIVDPGTKSNVILMDSASSNSTVTGVNFNCLRFVNGAKAIDHNDVEYTSLATWQAGNPHGYDANSIDTDPQFLDATENLFALDPASPCLVSGFNGSRQGPLPAGRGHSPNIAGSTFSGWTLTNCELDGSNHIILSAAQSVATAESPIMTFSESVVPSGFGCLGTEDIPAEVFDADDAEGVPHHLTVEFRSGDTDIEVAGSSYTKVPRGKSIGDVLSTAKLKWQAKVTLRNNGTGG